MNKYNNLDKTAANHSALTPLSLLQRSARIFPDKRAVIDDDRILSYRQLYQRCRQMGDALRRRGINPGDTVAILCPNSHEMLESHYSVPMAGAVLNSINIRLDSATIAFVLAHGEARVLFYDTQWENEIRAAIAELEVPPLLVAIERKAGASEGLADLGYEHLLTEGDPEASWQRPADEWDAITLNYTSGTTGNPKGVVYHHRGAYLAAMTNAMVFDMTAETVYLWTLPMFHCNGWAYTWAITAVGGTHVCLREVDAMEIYRRIEDYGVTHMCGAPVVMNMLLQDLGREGLTLSRPAHFALGGAAPPSSVIHKAEDIGFQVTHLYGLTETFGPSALCVLQPEWQQLPLEERAVKMSRQGVPTHGLDEVAVLDMDSGEPLPADGNTMGEICIRGNTVMKGYLKNAEATEKAFRDGWFHTGDLAVMHPDHYVEIRDRAKDVIISGGENISSLEVEEVLYRHPKVSEAAVVAMADEKWGEVPCAFVNPVDDGEAPTPEEIIAFCRERMAHFKAPRKVVLGELPKTATGKIRKNILRDSLSR
ncbi:MULTISPECIES: long-chain-fatty-acid--CoA ligase [Marinobacter]|uniref:Long-chain-fatty-acid--CoA ligase n=1 Tax=Marinobacter metalliresistant TaxID=2961995 RepID=A0ABZ2W3J3_9GAMM|nr:long-chain-fatty-acid--CoA ligase [Marinobacter sp. Arc7-DN-1]AXS81802.1 long-chain-fatty-acid--CoA ligase [Marinobacter sp. Arc7-DN-1]